MSLFGQGKTSLFGQTQPAQTAAPAQNTGFGFGQSQQQQQGSTLGASIQQPQAQQMPTLSQSQAQLSNSLWQPGKETPRMFFGEGRSRASEY